VHENLLRLGFEVEEEEIITPAMTAASLVGDRVCLPLVDESLLEDLSGVWISGESSGVVLVGDLGEGFTYERLNAAFRCLVDGAELVALQKNRFWRRSDGLALDAGPFVAALEYASGKTATVVGKPEGSFFRVALEDMGLETDEVAMVGDDTESDVAGARRMGIKGIQVKTGKYRPGDERGADLAVESFAQLPEALKI
jgi:HAD superfamily hydrolase (TIGR01458 family)